MEEQEPVPQKPDHPKIDIRLLSLVGANDQQFKTLLDTLIKEHAEPLINKIIGSKLKPHRNTGFNEEHLDAEDLHQDSLFKLIAYLNLFRTNPEDYAITAFEDFVAKITFNVYNNYLRKKYPLRTKLKRQLLHLVKSRKEFDLWEESTGKPAGRKLAGFVQWSGVQAENHNNALAELRQDSRAFLSAKFDGRPLNQTPVDQLLRKLFEWADRPIEINQLVDVIADLLGIKDIINNNWREGGRDKFVAEQVYGDQTLEFEQREYLKLLWNEIRDLPIRQRYALLLNLKDSDGDGVINAFPLCHIASPETIAQALEMKIEELEKIWDALPLKDVVIGSMLGGLTTQAVINLRKSARERLVRRLDKALKQLVKNKS